MAANTAVDLPSDPLIDPQSEAPLSERVGPGAGVVQLAPASTTPIPFVQALPQQPHRQWLVSGGASSPT